MYLYNLSIYIYIYTYHIKNSLKKIYFYRSRSLTAETPYSLELICAISWPWGAVGSWQSCTSFVALELWLAGFAMAVYDLGLCILLMYSSSLLHTLQGHCLHISGPRSPDLKPLKSPKLRTLNFGFTGPL